VFLVLLTIVNIRNQRWFVINDDLTSSHSRGVEMNSTVDCLLRDQNYLRKLSGSLGSSKRKRVHNIQFGIERDDVNLRPFDIGDCALARGKWRHIEELHTFLAFHFKLLRVRRGRRNGSRRRIHLGGRLGELLAIRVLFIDVWVAHELVIDGRRRLSIGSKKKLTLIAKEHLLLLGDQVRPAHIFMRTVMKDGCVKKAVRVRSPEARTALGSRQELLLDFPLGDLLNHL